MCHAPPTAHPTPHRTPVLPPTLLPMLLTVQAAPHGRTQPRPARHGTRTCDPAGESTKSTHTHSLNKAVYAAASATAPCVQERRDRSSDSREVLMLVSQRYRPALARGGTRCGQTRRRRSMQLLRTVRVRVPCTRFVWQCGTPPSSPARVPRCYVAGLQRACVSAHSSESACVARHVRATLARGCCQV